VATFLIVLAVGALAPTLVPKIKASMGEANVFRGMLKLFHDGPGLAEENPDHSSAVSNK
jgi:hypothetical protein